MLQTIAAFDRLGEENAFAVLARATALQQQGKDIINLGIGQPDFKTPPHIVEAAIKALRDGHHGYTPANGLLATREAVVRRTLTTTGVEVSPDSIMIMPGGKPTMFAAILMFGEPGAEILYPDPGFPIYRSMIEFTGAAPVPVPMRDANGFAFVPHRSAVKDFFDDEEVRRVYYPEVERIVKDATGASRVHIFDHTTRRRVPDAEAGADAPRQPVRRVHIDHTARSGPQRVRDLLPDEADVLLKGRVQVINLWRPIKGPLLDSPLAVCDATSIDFNDLVPSDLVYPHRVGETYSVKFNPAHRWYYVPRMRTDEALLLKCCDTATGVPARYTPHSAFSDPTAPADAPPRESIEVRVLVFHPA